MPDLSPDAALHGALAALQRSAAMQSEQARPDVEPPQAVSLRWRLFMILSTLVNVLFFGGDADETLSARAWRMHADPEWPNAWRRIDRVFGKDHCRRTHEQTVRRQVWRANRIIQP